MVSTTPNNPNQTFTKPTIAYQELETCLTKAVSAFNVREMLTKLGIPEDAKTMLELQMGGHSEPIARCEIPTTTKKDHILCGTMSLNGFHDLVIDNFINPALNILDLGKYLPDDDGRFANGEKGMKIIFRSSSPDFSMNLATFSFCCCDDPRIRCCTLCRASTKFR